MRKRKFIAALTLYMLFAVLSMTVLSVAHNKTFAEEIPVSRGEAVLEVSSGRVLFEHNADKVLPMASTTKILTAIIIIEDCNLDKIVEIPEEAAGTEGSSVYLVAGEKMTVRDLLYGLILRSGNDCAETLALYHSGSIKAFAECMNERAAKMGAKNSSFKNPHGLPAEGHYTTARDLAVIAVHALNNPEFSKIVSSTVWTVADGGCGYVRTFKNKNKMLYNYDGADGVKTGYTKEAGRCLVTSATRGGMRLVSVVLDSKAMYERSAQILDSCFEKYELKKLYCAGEHNYEVQTEVKGKICKGKCEKDFSYPLSKQEIEYVRIEEKLPTNLALPVRTGKEIGEIAVTFKNQLIFSQKIVSIMDVEKSYFDILQNIANHF